VLYCRRNLSGEISVSINASMPDNAKRATPTLKAEKRQMKLQYLGDSKDAFK